MKYLLLLSQNKTFFYFNFIFSVHKEKKTIQEDFEEFFAGLDEQQSQSSTPSTRRIVEETGISPTRRIVEESGISVSEQLVVENMAQDHDDFLNSLDAAPGDDSVGIDVVPEKKKVRVLTKKSILETKDYQKFINENPFISGPPKQGT